MGYGPRFGSRKSSLTKKHHEFQYSASSYPVSQTKTIRIIVYPEIVWICLRCFFTDRTIVNHHLSPPLGRIILYFFQASKIRKSKIVDEIKPFTFFRFKNHQLSKLIRNGWKHGAPPCFKCGNPTVEGGSRKIILHPVEVGSFYRYS